MLGAFLISGWFYYWTEHGDGLQYVGGIVTNNRGAIYGALVSLFGTMLGFSIATVSIVLGFAGSERLLILRQSKHYPVLWTVFTSANAVLGLATIVALIGLVCDRDTKPVHLLMHLNILFLLLSLARIYRCVWVLEKIIKIITKPVPPDNPA